MQPFYFVSKRQLKLYSICFFWTNTTDVFISEYVEGSSNNKAIEIFNGTGAAIDLSVGNYVVQLATVIPMKSKGSSDEIRILEQTPHSLFWDFDALGYICMGLATLIAVPAFEKHGFQKWVRISFIANAFVTPLISFVYFYPDYSETVLILGYPWAITAPLSMLLLAIMFRKKRKTTIINSDER